MQCIKECNDALGAAGAPVDDHDLLIIILNGLPDNYDAFVDFVQFRLVNTFVDVIHGFLLSKEMALAWKKQHQGSTDSFQAFHSVQATFDASLLLTLNVPPQAYTAQPQNNFQSNRGGNYQRNNSQRNYNNHTRYNRYNNRGGNHNFRSSNTRHVPCQICEDTGHLAIDCSNRMNPNFQGRVPPAKLAMYATSNTSSPLLWLLDPGASSHVTNNINNLQNPQPYTSLDKVYIRDGQGLPILHLGSSLLKTSYATRRMLFRGPVNRGLYPFLAST